MTTLFSKIYKYRESPFRNQKENYTNELLCYILQNDIIFSKNFFKHIGLGNGKIKNCRTQNSDIEGRPDISIEMTDGSQVLIECKIDSMQGAEQIKRYISILKRRKNRKSKLIYLTKYQEPLDISTKEPFQHIKWQDVYNFLNESTNKISMEFKKYMIENKMCTDYKFERREIGAIREYAQTFLKLSDMVKKIQDIAIRLKFEKPKYEENIHDTYIGIHFRLRKGYFWIGFFQYENHKEIQVGSYIEINKSEGVDKRMSEYLNSINYKQSEEENKVYWDYAKPITFFFRNDLLDISKLLGFAEDRIKEIERFRRKASH